MSTIDALFRLHGQLGQLLVRLSALNCDTCRAPVSTTAAIETSSDVRQVLQRMDEILERVRMEIEA